MLSPLGAPPGGLYFNRKRASRGPSSSSSFEHLGSSPAVRSHFTSHPALMSHLTPSGFVDLYEADGPQCSAEKRVSDAEPYDGDADRSDYRRKPIIHSPDPNLATAGYATRRLPLASLAGLGTQDDCRADNVTRRKRSLFHYLAQVSDYDNLGPVSRPPLAYVYG